MFFHEMYWRFLSSVIGLLFMNEAYLFLKKKKKKKTPKLITNIYVSYYFLFSLFSFFSSFSFLTVREGERESCS
jgi:hypothetical protein